MNHNRPSTRPARDTCRATRVRILLELARTFNREQVAYLMNLASRWGADEAYERGVADGQRLAEAEMTTVALAMIERTLTAPLVTERWHRMEGYRQRARHEADTAAGVPWRTDHPKGPVALTEDGDWLSA